MEMGEGVYSHENGTVGSEEKKGVVTDHDGLEKGGKEEEKKKKESSACRIWGGRKKKKGSLNLLFFKKKGKEKSTTLGKEGEVTEAFRYGLV